MWIRSDLTVNQATEIFENMRSALINAKLYSMANGKNNCR